MACEERGRAPRMSPNRTGQGVIERVVSAKLEHMGWGPKKLLAYLRQAEPGKEWPALSTVEKWLGRKGLVRRRRYRRRVTEYARPFLGCDEANRVWSADFKGQFRTWDGSICYPLTVSDNMSRYLLMCRGLNAPAFAETRRWFEWVLREHGLPEAIRTDNGTPFAGRGITGLSRLSVWWIKLGIRPERIGRGKPQDNGRHERMHRTLKDETASPPASDMTAQQARFDEFLRRYNEVRPHEAIGQRPPATLYARSNRRYPERLHGPDYDEGVEVRAVKRDGMIKFKSGMYYLTELLSGERVGLVEMDEACHNIMFGQHPIGVLDLRLGRVRPPQRER